MAAHDENRINDEDSRPRTLTDGDILSRRHAAPRSRMFVTGLGIGMVSMTASAVAGAGGAFAERLEAKGV